MLLSALVALGALFSRLDTVLPAFPPSAIPPARADAEKTSPHFDPTTRSVSNWHAQARENLFPRALALTASLSDDPPYVARCVRLNNGWCIKSARWPGEIGADGEGHTAFATMADGADAAADLLRRYVSTLGRRNALAIVRRWAPSECRMTGAPTGTAAALAPGGLGRTVRARYLAGHRPGAAARGRAVALRVQPWSPLARMASGRGRATKIRQIAAPRAVPDIATGIERPTPGKALERRVSGVGDPAAFLDREKTPSPDRMVAESARLPPIAAGLPLLDLHPPAPLCSGDETRIRAYAARIAASVGLRAGDDLDLFGSDGAPRPNLAPVMLAMSAVELGTLRAGPELVAAAIARLATPPPEAAGAGQASR